MEQHHPEPQRDPQEVLRRAAEANQRLREEIAEHRGETFDPELDEQFRQIVSSAETQPDPSRQGRARLVEIVDLAGPGGIMFSDLQDKLAEAGLRPSRSTLYTWLGQEKAAGTVWQPEGDKSPYVAARFRRTAGGEQS